MQSLFDIANKYIDTTRGKICKKVIIFLKFTFEDMEIMSYLQGDGQSDNNFCQMLFYDILMRLLRDLVY